MESYGNNSIPMVVFACEDQAVKLLDIFGWRKVEIWESRWKCWQSMPSGILKEVSVALK